MRCYIKYSKNTKKNTDLRLSIKIKTSQNNLITHATKLTADLADLECFNTDGSLKPKVKRQSAITLHAQVQEEIKECTRVYEELLEKGIAPSDITTTMFNNAFHENDKTIEVEEKNEKKLLPLLDNYIQDISYNLSRQTLKQYIILQNVLTRFLIIQNKIDIDIDNFNVKLALDFHKFYIEEYRYVQSYYHLYQNLRPYDIPEKERGSNTSAKKSKQLKAFFNYMNGCNITNNNPYNSPIIRKNKILVERYDNEPITFSIQEYNQLLNTPMPADLQETKDAFIMQCTIGARISDFKKLQKDSIKVTRDGIPYFEYVAQKTANSGSRPKRQFAPIVRMVYDILNKYDYQIGILHNISGKDGYNKKIKKMCEIAKLDRAITIYDNNGNPDEQHPLYELVTTHTARRICQTFMKRMFFNDDILELHTLGSSAKERYYDIDAEILQRFNIMNAIFNQQPYKVDNNLKIIL